MSILIKGMEMPDKCGHCRFATAFECEVTKNFITTFNVRQADCPLVPVPPHGRLIDADEMIEKYEELIERSKDGVIHMTYHDVIVEAIYDLKQASTVIPADKDGGT